MRKFLYYTVFYIAIGLSGMVSATTIVGKYNFSHVTTSNGIKGVGILTILDTKIQGDLVLEGVLIATNSVISGNILIKTHEDIELTNISVKSIKIIGDPNIKNQINIFLNTGVIIKGDIIFEGVSGLIYKANDVHIMGNIKNGKIIKMDPTRKPLLQ